MLPLSGSALLGKRPLSARTPGTTPHAHGGRTARRVAVCPTTGRSCESASIERYSFTKFRTVPARKGPRTGRLLCGNESGSMGCDPWLSGTQRAHARLRSERHVFGGLAFPLVVGVGDRI